MKGMNEFLEDYKNFKTTCSHGVFVIGRYNYGHLGLRIYSPAMMESHYKNKVTEKLDHGAKFTPIITLKEARTKYSDEYKKTELCQKTKRTNVNIKLSTGKTVLHYELENGAEGSENHSDLSPSEYKEYQHKLKQMRAKENKQPLICCCCSAYAGRWAQHWNRDTGFGICFKCIQWIRNDRPEEQHIKMNYGIEGINWGEIKNENK